MIHKFFLGSREIPQKFGPNRFSRFDINRIQTNKQTNKQTDKQSIYIDSAFRALRAHPLFKLLTDLALFVSILYLYSLKPKIKKFADFHNIFLRIFKFYKNKNL